jgi:hypothetical protein
VDEPLICPNCHVSLNEKQLVTKTVTVQSCPNCRAHVRQHEGFHGQDREALTLQDVKAIEDWLRSVVRGKPMAWSKQAPDGEKGKEIWDVMGDEEAGLPLPWECAVEYSSNALHVLQLRLTTERFGEEVARDKERLQTICADHGVQAFAVQRSRTDWTGKRQEVRWGAYQILATGSLSERLFWSVLERLERAMRDVTARVPA